MTKKIDFVGKSLGKRKIEMKKLEDILLKTIISIERCKWDIEKIDNDIHKSIILSLIQILIIILAWILILNSHPSLAISFILVSIGMGVANLIK